MKAPDDFPMKEAGSCDNEDDAPEWNRNNGQNGQGAAVKCDWRSSKYDECAYEGVRQIRQTEHTRSQTTAFLME